jgi:glycosyltransferase involved in cell wall biosynthesis
MALYPDTRQPPANDIAFAWSSRPTGLLPLIRAIKKLADALRRDRPSVVFTAMPLTNLIFPIVAALSGGKTRVVVVHHSPLTSNGPIYRVLDSIISSTHLVNNVVCVSLSVYGTQPDLKAYRQKSLVIKNALSPEIEARIAHMAKSKAGDRASTARVVVAAGRLSPEKNYDLLIRAAALTPDLLFKIAGSGPDEQRLKDLAKSLNIADRIDFIGFQPRLEVLEMLAAGDIFVQPSLYEGHSLALIEAAKLGLPLIVSNVPSQVEGITSDDGVHCGHAVDVDDVPGLADAMLALANDPEHHQRLSELSRELGRQSNYEAMLEKYQNIVRLGAA